MPPKKRASLAEDYSSDGGFVANDSDSDRPKAKKPKTAKSNNSTKPTGNKPSSSTKSIGGGGVETAEEVFWEVSTLTPKVSWRGKGWIAGRGLKGGD